MHKDLSGDNRIISSRVESASDSNNSDDIFCVQLIFLSTSHSHSNSSNWHSWPYLLPHAPHVPTPLNHVPHRYSSKPKHHKIHKSQDESF